MSVMDIDDSCKSSGGFIYDEHINAKNNSNYGEPTNSSYVKTGDDGANLKALSVDSLSSSMANDNNFMTISEKRRRGF